MARFHLTDEGNPGLCRAKQGRCPYGGAHEHYGSKEEAREAYEAEQAMGDLLALAMRKRMSATPEGQAMQDQIDRNAVTKKELYKAYAERGDEVRTEDEFSDAPLSLLHAYNQSYETYEKGLTEEEKAALHAYTGIGFDTVNSYLRDPESFAARSKTLALETRREWIEDQLPRLDSALAKAPSEERRLFRRLDQSSTQDLEASEEWAGKLGFEEGETVTFAAYSSTTVNPGYIARTTQSDPHTSLVLAFESKKGAPVGLTAVEHERRYTQEGEAEILLPRDASYRVKRVARAGYSSKGFDRVEVLTVFLEELDS